MIERAFHTLVVLLLPLATFTAYTARAEAAGPAISSVTVVEPASGADVPRYGKLELLVEMTGLTAVRFYDPDPASSGIDLTATFTAPSGGTVTVPGYYDGAAFRVRFAPTATGTWTFSLRVTDPAGAAEWTGGSLVCGSSALSGFVRIDGRSLRFQDGRSLFAVGHNNGWQYDVEQPALADMAGRGENLLSFWLATPWATPTSYAHRAPIENATGGVGEYDQSACAYLDGVIARAEAAGICLQPAIWSHGELRDTGHPWGQGWWYNNGYKGLCTAADFFKTSDGSADTPQWRCQKNLFRYILARWGYSRAIASWVAVVELDGTSGYYQNPTQATAWCAAVRDYFAANDFNRRNAAGQVPVATFKVDGPTFDPGFHLRAVDTYAKKGDNLGVALQIASQTITMRASGKPCFHGEFGGDVLAGASQPAHLHNGIWAGTAAGAAMTPLVWCDGGNFPMLTDPSVGEAMRSQLQHLADFVGGLEYQGDAGLTAATVSLDAGSCRGWGLRLTDRGFAWAQNTAGTMGGQTLTVSTLAAGLYRVSWYDAWTSGRTAFRVDENVAVGADGALRIAVPALARSDIACRFEKTGETAFGAKINFQPASAAVPAGYLADSGAAYGDRGNGLIYGWNAVNSNAYDRNSRLSPDQRYDTLISTQTKKASFRWEIAVPNGSYRVRLVAGDPTTYSATYRFDVEGIRLIDGRPTKSSRWLEGSVTVTVSDGRLTLTNGAGAVNNRVCFIEIEAAGP